MQGSSTSSEEDKATDTNQTNPKSKEGKNIKENRIVFQNIILEF